MFSLNIFTYIVVAGCLDHRKVSITKKTKTAYKLKNSSQHSLLALDVSVSLLFPPFYKRFKLQYVDYILWTIYHTMDVSLKKYLRMWTNLIFPGYLDLYLE